MRINIYILLLCFLIAGKVEGQLLDTLMQKKIVFGGEIITAEINEEGDTILLAELDEIGVSSPRSFRNTREKFIYDRYRRYSAVVYPYATRAIEVFKEVEEDTQGLKRRKKKKHAKKIKKMLSEEFKKPLKKLTKTQGRILLKMIEKELDTPMYTLIKEYRGGLNARYWQTLGKTFGYDLKRGYVRGDDKILDIVLDDFDVSVKNY